MPHIHRDRYVVWSFVILLLSETWCSHVSIKWIAEVSIFYVYQSREMRHLIWFARSFCYGSTSTKWGMVVILLAYICLVSRVVPLYVYVPVRRDRCTVIFACTHPVWQICAIVYMHLSRGMKRTFPNMCVCVCIHCPFREFGSALSKWGYYASGQKFRLLSSVGKLQPIYLYTVSMTIPWLPPVMRASGIVGIFGHDHIMIRAR